MTEKRTPSNSEQPVHTTKRPKVAHGLRHIFSRQRRGNVGEQKATVKTVAANIKSYISWYGQNRPTTDKEVADAAALLDGAGDNLAEQLGYKRIKLKTSPSNKRFLKENDPFLRGVSERDFRVVTDEDQQTWLLKAADYGGPQTNDPQVMHNVLNMQVAESEVLAYRMACALGYSVPETKLIQPDMEDEDWGGRSKPHLGYRFIPNALDHSYYTSSSRLDMFPDRADITNPNDVAFRGIFNALIGSFGDGANQGIVDQETGRYYAQDLGVGSKLIYKDGRTRFGTWSEALDSYFSEPGEASFYDRTGWSSTPAQDSDFNGYFDVIRSLTPETVTEILAPDTPLMQAELPELSQAIAKRALVLTAMYDAGRFSVPVNG
ncbi:MAG: hypothetical protein V4702_04265 [Patescibacteria group bacterium]